jgi:hypothetical protein
MGGTAELYARGLHMEVTTPNRMIRAILEKATVAQLITKFPSFYETRMFSVVLRRTNDPIPSQMKPVHTLITSLFKIH